MSEKRHIHIGCICFTFQHCASSNVSSNSLLYRMHSHIGCICLVFLHCIFSNVSLLHLDQIRNIQSGYTCVFSNVISNCFHNLMQNYIGCIYLAFLHYVFSYVTSNRLLLRMKNLHSLHLFGFSPVWVFKCLLKWL